MNRIKEKRKLLITIIFVLKSQNTQFLLNFLTCNVKFKNVIQVYKQEMKRQKNQMNQKLNKKQVKNCSSIYLELSYKLLQ